MCNMNSVKQNSCLDKQFKRPSRILRFVVEKFGSPVAGYRHRVELRRAAVACGAHLDLLSLSALTHAAGQTRSAAGTEY